MAALHPRQNLLDQLRSRMSHKTCGMLIDQTGETKALQPGPG
jgi:hypothetical protein